MSSFELSEDSNNCLSDNEKQNINKAISLVKKVDYLSSQGVLGGEHIIKQKEAEIKQKENEITQKDKEIDYYRKFNKKNKLFFIICIALIIILLIVIGFLILKN
jgi:hypothetical protein